MEGVSLYPGTKHSTATDLKNTFGYEAAIEATGHTTDKAFGRYILRDSNKLRSLYSYARSGKALAKNFSHQKDGNILNLNGKDSRGRGI